MSFENNLSLDFLKKDNENLSKNGQDSSEGIVPSKEFEEVSVNQNGDGTWSKSSVEKKSPVKKDITARSDEDKQYSEEVGALETYAKVSDNKIISIATQINEKKQLIFDKVTEAIAAGCSVGIGTFGVDAIVNGVTIGVGFTITDDYPFIKKYVGLDDPTAEVPFNSDNTVTLTASNSGKGYFSGFTENGGSNVGIYRTVFYDPLTYPTGPEAEPITFCAYKTGQIITLANEINVLRSQIDIDLISVTNTIKDRKTTSEVFVWGYASREHKVQDQIDINNTVINTINTSSILNTVIQDQSLKLYYDADENNALQPDEPGTGGEWKDISGNGNHGTITNANYVNTSPQHFNFNGSNAVVTSQLEITHGNGDITYECWVRTTDGYTPNDWESLMSTYGGSSSENGFWILLKHPDTYITVGNDASVYTITSTAVNDGNWHHIVAMYTNPLIVDEGLVRIYFDGAYIGGRSDAPNNNLPPRTLSIGSMLALGSADRFFNGDIGEVRVYNRTLSPTEITQNYNATKARYE